MADKAAWDESHQLLSMQVVGQVQGLLERFQVAIAQQIQQLGMQQQYHQAIHQQMLQQILQQQQEQKALLQRREAGSSQPSGWPQVYMHPPGSQHPAISKEQQPLLQLPPLLQSIPTASKSDRPLPKPRAKSQAEEKLSERSMMEATPLHPPQEAEETKDATPPEQPTAEKEAKESKETNEGKEEQEGQGDTIEAVASSPASPSKPEAARADTAQPRDEPGECVSRVERTHEETRQKERDEKNQSYQKSREADKSGRWSKHSKWKESQSSNTGRKQRVADQFLAASWRSQRRSKEDVAGPRRMGKSGPRTAAAETNETYDTRPTRGKMNQRSGEVLQWHPKYR